MSSIKNGCPICKGEILAEEKIDGYEVRCKNRCYSEKLKDDKFLITLFGSKYVFDELTDKSRKTIEILVKSKKKELYAKEVKN